MVYIKSNDISEKENQTSSFSVCIKEDLRKLREENQTLRSEQSSLYDQIASLEIAKKNLSESLGQVQLEKQQLFQELKAAEAKIQQYEEAIRYELISEELIEIEPQKIGDETSDFKKKQETRLRKRKTVTFVDEVPELNAKASDTNGYNVTNEIKKKKLNELQKNESNKEVSDQPKKVLIKFKRPFNPKKNLSYIWRSVKRKRKFKENKASAIVIKVPSIKKEPIEIPVIKKEPEEKTYWPRVIVPALNLDLKYSSWKLPDLRAYVSASSSRSCYRKNSKSNPNNSLSGASDRSNDNTKNTTSSNPTEKVSIKTRLRMTNDQKNIPYTDVIKNGGGKNLAHTSSNLPKKPLNGDSVKKSEYKCATCGKVSNSKTSYNIHLRRHSGKALKKDDEGLHRCTKSNQILCTRGLHQRNSLRPSNNRSISSKAPSKSKSETKPATKKRDFDGDNSETNTKFVENCGKKTASASNNYVCNVCNKSFRQLFHLIMHKERTQACQESSTECNNSSANSSETEVSHNTKESDVDAAKNTLVEESPNTKSTVVMEASPNTEDTIEHTLAKESDVDTAKNALVEVSSNTQSTVVMDTSPNTEDTSERTLATKVLQSAEKSHNNNTESSVVVAGGETIENGTEPILSERELIVPDEIEHCSLCGDPKIGNGDHECSRIDEDDYILDVLLFVCATCGESFANKSTLENHRSSHNEQEKSICVEHKHHSCSTCDDFLNNEQDIIISADVAGNSGVADGTVAGAPSECNGAVNDLEVTKSADAGKKAVNAEVVAVPSECCNAMENENTEAHGEVRGEENIHAKNISDSLNNNLVNPIDVSETHDKGNEEERESHVEEVEGCTTIETNGFPIKSQTEIFES